MAESIETRHENWLRVVWGLLYVREGLQGYVDTKGKQQYQTFISSVNAKCNNQTCDQCQINSQCQNGKTKVTGKSPFRPAHFCDAMFKEIQISHARNNPFWVNTDSTKWQDPHVGYWEVTKCYLSSAGYFDKNGTSQIDASGLLSICINSSFIKQHITNIQQFKELRDIRNTTLHDARYELEGQTADDCLDKMITVLQDPQELIHDKFAQQAAHAIRNIKAKIEKTPAIMTETLQKWLQTNFDVDRYLKEIEGLMYDRLRKELKGFIVDEVKREVKHSFDERGNYDREHNLEDSCDLCDLTDMIRDQLINRIYPQNQRDAAYLTMQSVLSKNKCVIIADGLDEWIHPNDTKCSCPKEEKVIPYLETTLDTTVFITSRPWRMSKQRVKDTKIDTYLEIEGTADLGLLLQKILNILNETVTVKKTMLDSVKFVDRMTLTRLLSVPIISMLLRAI
ncbi:hypothetical protein MAR_003001 [Mya arenaria]|uniref:NACHT domain-containing protein n=1 Tax=Mya arenaria TaxID=6604 RepID=A0ABY7G4R3_MYAAR|nr:hypothetical protein MAR_003001 [Mya arenaria]